MIANITKKKIVYGISSLLSILSLASCGSYDDPTLTGMPVNYQNGVYLAQNQQASACSCACPNQTTDDTSVTDPNLVQKKKKVTTSPTKATTVTSKSAVKTPTGTNTPTPNPTATPTANSTTDDNASKGRKALDKVMNYIKNANAFQCDVDKYEKDLNSGKEIQQKFKINAKKPGQMKLDIIYHTNASSIGAKLSYVRGSGKATVRPGGALKFITKELDMNDSNIISPNNYTPEQVDFFALSQRLSKPSYNVEITGKTTMDGVEVYVLKITSQSNDLDSKISYENIAFDPKTFQPKMWEAYTASSAEAYIRMTIKTFTVLNDLPDSNFKV